MSKNAKYKQNIKNSADNEIVIDVEEIMAEIRQQIKKENHMVEIAPFSEILLPSVENASSNTENISSNVENEWQTFTSVLQNVNRTYLIPYYWDLGPKGIKTFVKRVIRKLIKFIVLPIVDKQTEFNSYVTRCCNHLGSFVEKLLANDSLREQNIDGLQQELKHKDEELSDIKTEINNLKQSLESEKENYAALLQTQKDNFTDQISGLKREHLELLNACEHSFNEQINSIQENLINMLSSWQDQEQNILEQIGILNEKCEKILVQAKEENGNVVEKINLLNQSLQEEVLHIQRWQSDRDDKLQAIARDTIRTKWGFRDYIESLQDSLNNDIKCGICGYHGKTEDFEIKESECIFEGGKLLRYVCPECGAIFGPIKFSKQSKAQFDDDYTVHYTGFHEGDSTEKEIRAFMLLQPDKNGIYLNYGCGSWSATMQELQHQGYTVYGYEPYSRNIDNPFIISDKEILRKMRFNGIFSQDVLEHFSDPISELMFMKSLLVKPDSRMSHCTGCYDYKYEYTRFHMFFFTGKALDIVCQKAGLNIVETADAFSDIGEKDFHCKVFEMQEKEIDYLPLACINAFAKVVDEGICLYTDGICCGPYIDLPQGEYLLNINLQLPLDKKYIDLSITACRGQQVIKKNRLRNDNNFVKFSLPEFTEQVEFVIQNSYDEDILIKQIVLC